MLTAEYYNEQYVKERVFSFERPTYTEDKECWRRIVKGELHCIQMSNRKRCRTVNTQGLYGMDSVKAEIIPADPYLHLFDSVFPLEKESMYD